jgi:hypothetical protein
MPNRNASRKEMEKAKEDGLGILPEGLSVDIGFLGSATAKFFQWQKAGKSSQKAVFSRITFQF